MYRAVRELIRAAIIIPDLYQPSPPSCLLWSPDRCPSARASLFPSAHDCANRIRWNPVAVHCVFDRGERGPPANPYRFNNTLKPLSFGNSGHPHNIAGYKNLSTINGVTNNTVPASAKFTTMPGTITFLAARTIPDLNSFIPVTIRCSQQGHR